MINTESITKSFLDKLPEQFKRKHNIDVLVRAFAAELEELVEVFRELETLRSIKTAFGRQLDGIGEIVNLSRVESTA